MIERNESEINAYDSGMNAYSLQRHYTNLFGDLNARFHRWDTRDFPVHCAVFLHEAHREHTDRGTSIDTRATHKTNPDIMFDFIKKIVVVSS